MIKRLREAQENATPEQYGPLAVEDSRRPQKNIVGLIIKAGHLLGADSQGREMFSRTSCANRSANPWSISPLGISKYLDMKGVPVVPPRGSSPV